MTNAEYIIRNNGKFADYHVTFDHMRNDQVKRSKIIMLSDDKDNPVSYIDTPRGSNEEAFKAWLDEEYHPLTHEEIDRNEAEIADIEKKKHDAEARKKQKILEAERFEIEERKKAVKNRRWDVMSDALQPLEQFTVPHLEEYRASGIKISYNFIYNVWDGFADVEEAKSFIRSHKGLPNPEQFAYIKIDRHWHTETKNRNDNRWYAVTMQGYNKEYVITKGLCFRRSAGIGTEDYFRFKDIDDFPLYIDHAGVTQKWMTGVYDDLKGIIGVKERGHLHIKGIFPSNTGDNFRINSVILLGSVMFASDIAPENSNRLNSYFRDNPFNNDGLYNPGYKLISYNPFLERVTEKNNETNEISIRRR